MRRGDLAAAVKILTPWAEAGLVRAQLLLAGAQERRAGPGSLFSAYVWYGIAARLGDAGATALRDRVALRLQPAEMQQANEVIEGWRSGPEPTTASKP
jgi:TPR repeat protein